MDNAAILALAKRIVSDELALNVDGLSEEQTLDAIGIDSIGLMTLIVYLEEELSISVDFDSNWPIEITSITMKQFIDNIKRIVETKQQEFI